MHIIIAPCSILLGANIMHVAYNCFKHSHAMELKVGTFIFHVLIWFLPIP